MRWALAAVLAALMLVGAACGGGDEEDDALVVAIADTPEGIDLDLQTSPDTWQMAGQVLAGGMTYARIEYPHEPSEIGDPTEVEGLTYPDLSLDEIEPGVVESCELSDNGQRATYHLREGVVSPYGNELTADDVIWRVERAIDLEAIGFFFLNVAGAPDIDQWNVRDDHTVQITSDQPMPMICKINAHLTWTFLDSTEAQEHATADDPWATEWMATNDASFGPYHITEWTAGERVVMEANPNYYGEEPSIKRITFTVVPESSNRLALLQAGDVDVAQALSPEEMASLEGPDGVTPVAIRSNLQLFIVTNNEVEPFDDPQVRRAINLAIPRQDVAESIFRGLAAPTEGPFPPIFPGYAALNEYEFDPDEARRLLADAGYPDGFSTSLTFSTGDPVQEQIAVLLRSTLAEIGVDVSLQRQPPAAHSQEVTAGEAEFALWQDAPFLPDPNFSAALFFHSDSAPNFANYASSRVDGLIEEGARILDLDESIEHHLEVQRLLHADAPYAFIVSPDFAVGLRDNVTGWGWDPANYYRIQDMAKE